MWCRIKIKNNNLRTLYYFISKLLRWMNEGTLGCDNSSSPHPTNINVPKEHIRRSNTYLPTYLHFCGFVGQPGPLLFLPTTLISYLPDSCDLPDGLLINRASATGVSAASRIPQTGLSKCWGDLCEDISAFVAKLALVTCAFGACGRRVRAKEIRS
jgi:hypothetical protein